MSHVVSCLWKQPGPKSFDRSAVEIGDSQGLPRNKYLPGARIAPAPTIFAPVGTPEGSSYVVSYSL